MGLYSADLSTLSTPIPHHQGLLSPRDTIGELPEGDIDGPRTADDSSDMVQHGYITVG